MCSTRVDDAICVQSKDIRKYLQFQRDPKFNLYYMDVSKKNVVGRCYFNTVKKGKSLFSILDQNRAKAVRTLQVRCFFLSDGGFINELECNSIEGVVFGRLDMKIANEIYGYSTGAAMGKFKYPRKGVKMDRTTEDHRTLQEYTLRYRPIICEQDTVPFGKIKGYWIHPL